MGWRSKRMTDDIDNGGRPSIELDQQQVQEVETLAAVLTQDQMADYFGFSSRTFRNMMKRDERVFSAYKKGRAKAIGLVSQSLLASATRGNTTAAIFYLKTQAGWREQESEAQDLPPVVINLTTDAADQAAG